MPRLVIAGDVHYSKTEPECRSPSYAKEILEKLHEVAMCAGKLKAPAVAFLGDIYHRKGRVTHAEVNDLLSVLASWRERNLEAIGILGNHDVSGVGLDSMDTRAAGALHHSRVLRILDIQPWRYEDEDGALYVTGTSYFHGCDRNDENRIRMYGEVCEDQEALHVHLAHGALVLNGGFPDEFTAAEDLIPLLAEAGRLPDIIVCGHLHYREGIRYFDRPDGRGQVAVCRIGSLARVSRDDLDRIPAALVLASKGRSYALREHPVGKAVQASELPTDDPRDPREHEMRIKEFAAKLAEESEHVSLSDDNMLLTEIAERLGYGAQAVLKAHQAVEARK